jgi:hypothetical protein
MTYYRITYQCRKCGYEYSVITYSDSDEFTAKITNLKQKCTKCEVLMVTIPNVLERPLLKVTANKLYFAGFQILEFTDKEIVINLTVLKTIGFSGKIRLTKDVGPDEYSINSINDTIKMIIRNGKPLLAKSKIVVPKAPVVIKPRRRIGNGEN